jgi:hypothetical protein
MSTAPAPHLESSPPQLLINDDYTLQHSQDDDDPIIGPNTDNEILREFISTTEQFKGFLDTLPATRPIGSLVPLWASPSEEWRFRQNRQALGEQILKAFPPKVVCDELLRAYFSVFDHIRPCVPQSWMKQALEEIFEIDGRMEVVEKISNTVEIVEANSSNTLSSSSVNWNTIGTLAAILAIGAFTAPQLLDADTVQFYTQLDIMGLAVRLKKVVGMCWQLQKPTELPDESTILLLYHYVFLLIVFGEYIPFFEHLFACLVHGAAVISLHRDIPQNNQSAHHLEMRHTMYAAIYHLDKMRATYKGRPPLMFHRFNNIELPPEHTQATRHLRAQTLLSHAREEVLELILTNNRPQAEMLR